MKQSVSPVAALVIIIVIVAILGGIFYLRSRPSPEEAKATASRGAEAGKMMMQGVQKTSPEEMAQRMRGGSR